MRRCWSASFCDSPKRTPEEREPINITRTEFKLLCLLAGRPGEVQTRETLLRDVWGYEPTLDTRTVDTTIQRLRSKLGNAADHLETVRGVGYRYIETKQ